jgi:hypothetical protein
MPNIPLTVPSPYFKQRKTKGASDRELKKNENGKKATTKMVEAM